VEDSNVFFHCSKNCQRVERWNTMNTYVSNVPINSLLMGNPRIEKLCGTHISPVCCTHIYRLTNFDCNEKMYTCMYLKHLVINWTDHLINWNNKSILAFPKFSCCQILCSKWIMSNLNVKKGLTLGYSF